MTNQKIKNILEVLFIIGIIGGLFLYVSILPPFHCELIVVNDTDVNLRTSAIDEYSKSPSNTDVSMIDGTFDDTDNMKINDNSNSVFTSTDTVAIPDEFANSITILAGVYVSGTVEDTWVDNAVAHVVSGTYVTSVQINFDPALAGRDFYVSGHFTTNGMSGTLIMNSVGWKTAQTIDFDNEVYNGLNTIVYTAGSMGALQGKVFYFKLVEVGDPTAAEINYTMDISFSEIQTEELLNVNVSSFHFTDYETTIIGNIYNYDTSSYVQMFSSSNTEETENFFEDDSDVNDYLNASGNLRIYFTGINSDYTFDVIMDYIVITFGYTWVDRNPPTWDTLTESADPLELGNIEIININVYDVSIISTVYLEFDASNHSMSFISGDTYRYSIWEPTSVGIKTYQIHMIDEFGNINQTGDLTITVEDTVNPVVDNIIESEDPLQLTNIEIIEGDITDESSIIWVYLEFEGSNHSMSFVSGIKWEYTSWIPLSVGNYLYTIYANDSEGNIGFASGNITVIGGQPIWENLIESANPLELGLNESIQIDVYSNNTITFVYLEFNGVNHSMVLKITNFTWYYDDWVINSSGSHFYSIYLIDNYNLTTNISGSILVVSSSILFLSIFIISLLMLAMIYFYFKHKVFLIIFTIFLFSIIFGFAAFTVVLFPFTPYLQIFFMLFQSSIFLITTENLFSQRGKK